MTFSPYPKPAPCKRKRAARQRNPKTNTQARGKNKYGAERAERAGIWFDSQAEAALYDWLVLLQKNGEIKNLRLQPQVRLTRAGIGYKPDFSFFEVKRGLEVFAEMKGFETEGWLIRKKLWTVYGPAPLQIWKCGKHGPLIMKEIWPKGAE